MAVIEINDLSVTDASNINHAPEAMAPSAVNNGIRAVEGLVSRAFRDAVEGNLNLSGGGTAYTLTINRTQEGGLYDGFRQGFHVNTDNTGAVTLELTGSGSFGAKDVKKNGNTSLQKNGQLCKFYVTIPMRFCNV